MDLSGQAKIKTLWNADPVTGLTTITFKTDDEATTLGDIIIETTKLRALAEMTDEVARYFSPDGQPRQGQITLFDNRILKAETEFRS
jgi:hypothetical protein